MVDWSHENVFIFGFKKLKSFPTRLKWTVKSIEKQCLSIQVKPAQGGRRKFLAGSCSYVPIKVKAKFCLQELRWCLESSQLFSLLFSPLILTSSQLFSTDLNLLVSSHLFQPHLNSSHLFSTLFNSSQFLSSLINSSQLFLPLLDSSHLFPTIFPPLASQFFPPFLTSQLFLRDPHLLSTHFPLLISSHLLKSCLNAPQVFSRPVLKPSAS